MRDLKFALRQLLKNRGFTAVVVATLALGIGANTAVFSLVNDVLLRTLPVKSPEELILLRNVQGRGGRMSRAGENNGSIDPVTGRSASTSFSLLQFQRFHDYHPALTIVFAYAPINRVSVLIDGQPETITLGQLVSGEYHAGLGVSAIVGRTLTPADDQPSAPAVAVISYRYWETRFGRDPGTVGKEIQVNRVPVTLIGVTRPGFAGAMQVGESADITLALAQHTRVQPDRAESRSQPWYWWIRVMGRLAPGATAAQAAASLERGLAVRHGADDAHVGRDAEHELERLAEDVVVLDEDDLDGLANHDKQYRIIRPRKEGGSEVGRPRALRPRGPGGRRGSSRRPLPTHPRRLRRTR